VGQRHPQSHPDRPPSRTGGLKGMVKAPRLLRPACGLWATTSTSADHRSPLRYGLLTTTARSWHESSTLAHRGFRVNVPAASGLPGAVRPVGNGAGYRQLGVTGEQLPHSDFWKARGWHSELRALVETCAWRGGRSWWGESLRLNDVQPSVVSSGAALRTEAWRISSWSHATPRRTTA